MPVARAGGPDADPRRRPAPATGRARRWQYPAAQDAFTVPPVTGPVTGAL